MKVWIDVDNAPHVQIFRPIVSRLRELGATVEVTARDRTFVPQLLQSAGIEHTVIGRGQPASGIRKAAALASRAASLARFAMGRRFDVAAGHGSRSLPPAARLLGVPNLTMFDYEHVSTWLFHRFCDRILMPRAAMNGGNRICRAFDGFKEEIYLAGFRPDPGLRPSLGVHDDDVLVVVRPPSRTAHYHDPRSEAIVGALVMRLAEAEGVKAVWLRRDPDDPGPAADRPGNFIVPRTALDGPSLLAAADLAVSGGGTMNREAALLGTPAFSIFTGPPGILDGELIEEGRLVPIRSASEVGRIPLVKKTAGRARPCDHRLRDFVVGEIRELARGS